MEDFKEGLTGRVDVSGGTRVIDSNDLRINAAAVGEAAPPPPPPATRVPLSAGAPAPPPLTPTTIPLPPASQSQRWKLFVEIGSRGRDDRVGAAASARSPGPRSNGSDWESSGATGNPTGATGNRTGATGNPTGPAGEPTGPTGEPTGPTGEPTGPTGRTEPTGPIARRPPRPTGATGGEVAPPGPTGGFGPTGSPGPGPIGATDGPGPGPTGPAVITPVPNRGDAVCGVARSSQGCLGSASVPARTAATFTSSQAGSQPAASLYGPRRAEHVRLQQLATGNSV